MAMLRVYLVSALVSAVVAAVVGAGAAFVTGRYVASFSPQSVGPSAGAISVQEGTAEARWGEIVDVFYNPPFAVPPNLTFPDGLDNTCHVERKADSFKLRRDAGGIPGPQYPAVRWKAEGPAAAPSAPPK